MWQNMFLRNLGLLNRFFKKWSKPWWKRILHIPWKADDSQIMNMGEDHELRNMGLAICFMFGLALFCMVFAINVLG